MTPEQIMTECLSCTELVANYDRLYGASLGRVLSASPIEKMVDESSGFASDEMRKFFDFVFEFVILPLTTKKAA